MELSNEAKLKRKVWTVLFVAEKMAALEVVKRRLDKYIEKHGNDS